VRAAAFAMFLLLAVLLVGVGGSSASITTTCAAPLCVTVEDVDGLSPSTNGPPEVVAYQFYKVNVSNTGGTPLTGGTIDVLLTDTVGSSQVNSDAQYVSTASTNKCVRISTNPNLVRCTIGTLGAGATTNTFLLAYKTSRTPGATSTNAAITVSFGSTQVSTVEQTILETDPNDSSAWSPPGKLVKLGTAPNFDQQFSTLQYTVPGGGKAFVSSMDESNGSVCAPTLTCVGQLVTTDLSGAFAGTFSPANLFHLTITIPFNLRPSTPIAISHRLDNGTFEIIRQRCSTTPPTSTSQLPCFTLIEDPLGGILVADVWGFQNGGWMIGG
jgi:hypothetical protein